MAYFEHDQETRQHRRVFREPAAAELDDVQEEKQQEYFDEDYDGYQDDADDYEYEEEDELSEEERVLAQRDHWRVLAGIGDFLAIVVGTAVILVLIALLVSLVNWVHADISQSFTLWQTKI